MELNKIIRLGVFETNSSSAHTIVLAQSYSAREEIPDSISLLDLDESGNLILGQGEYGWGPDTVSGWYGKADYLALDFQDDEDLLDLLRGVIVENIPGDYTVKFVSSGYIDHQSYGCARDAGLTTKEAIKDFLFNPDAYIEIDNDNH